MQPTNETCEHCWHTHQEPLDVMPYGYVVQECCKCYANRFHTEADNAKS